VLAKIGRKPREYIFRALDTLSQIQQHAPLRINGDWILGLPHESPGGTLDHIKNIHTRYPRLSHTSVYMLEDGLYPQDWKKHQISEQEMEAEYADICRYLAMNHWHHYEISNWAKPGDGCAHNQAYWDHEPYRGFGLSATSYWDGVRSENSASFSGYYRGEIGSQEHLTPEQIQYEKIIYDLRTFRFKTM